VSPDGRPEPTPEPVFSVVRGHPDDDELAALVAVLRMCGSADPEDAVVTQESGWSAYWRAVRAPLAPGPGAWRASLR